MQKVPEVPAAEFRSRMRAAGFSIRPEDEESLREGLAALLALTRHVHVELGYADEPAVVFRAGGAPDPEPSR